jgi:hypothetical protein
VRRGRGDRRGLAAAHARGGAPPLRRGRAGATAGRRGHWLAVPAQLRAQPVNTHPPHSAVSWRRPPGAAVLALLQALEGTPLYADGFSEGSAAAVSTRNHNQN